MTTEAAAPTSPAEQRLERIGLVVLLFAVLALWAPAVRCGFTLWDDPAFCVRNPDVEAPDLARLFDPHHWVVSDWTPLAILSYAPERWLLGPEPWVPHAVNVLLHGVSVLLAYRLLRDLGVGVRHALLAAAIYGVHPLQAESVVWVSARKNVLMAVFAFSFLRSYLAGRHLTATLWFVMGLCSKATGVGLPLVAAAAHLLGLGAPRRRTTYAWIGLWLCLSALRGRISVEAQVEPVAKIAALGLGGRMQHMGSVLTTQLRQVFAPYDLSVLYATPRRAWSDPVLLGQWALVGVVAGSAAFAARRDRRLAFMGVFTLITLAPTLNVFPGPCLQADRYLQLPLLGIGLFVVSAVEPLARLGRHVPTILVTLWIAAVLVPFSAARTSVWTSDETLWEDTRTKTPDSGVAWAYTGVIRAQKGEFPGAIAAFRRSLELRPEADHTALDLAVALTGAGHDDEAAAIARRLTAVPRVAGEAHGLIGFLLARRGRIEEAGREFDEARRLDPGSERVRDWFNSFVAASMRTR